MDRDAALQRAREAPVKAGSLSHYLRELILGGFFDAPHRTREVTQAIRERFGRRFPTSYVQTYAKPFLEAGVLRAQLQPGPKGNVWSGAWLTDTELGFRGAAERLKIKLDTAGWSPEVAEDFQLALSCYTSELWKPAAVMTRRAYEGALITRYCATEMRQPEKDATCPKCSAKFGKRPLSLTDLHHWAASRGLVRDKMDGLGILLKDLGAGGAHPTKAPVIDPDTAEIIVKCGAVLLRDLHKRPKRARRRRPTRDADPPATAEGLAGPAPATRSRPQG